MLLDEWAICSINAALDEGGLPDLSEVDRENSGGGGSDGATCDAGSVVAGATEMMVDSIGGEYSTSAEDRVASCKLASSTAESFNQFRKASLFGLGNYRCDNG